MSLLTNMSKTNMSVRKDINTNIKELLNKRLCASPNTAKNSQQEDKVSRSSDDDAGAGSKKAHVFDCSDVVIGREIIRDEFGSVRSGYLHFTDKSKRTLVAVKMLFDFINCGPDPQFLKDISNLMELNHPFIVKLFGYDVLKPPRIIVQEHCRMGPLLYFLRENPTAFKPDTDIKVWAHQIASGMDYLGTKNMSSKLVALTSKWYAPEVIRRHTFSTKSDIYAYGVLLCELYSFGAEPWGPEFKNGLQVIKMIEDGIKLSIPTACPQNLNDQLLACFNLDPLSRPTFKDFMDFFGKLDDKPIRVSQNTTSVTDYNANNIEEKVPPPSANLPVVVVGAGDKGESCEKVSAEKQPTKKVDDDCKRCKVCDKKLKETVSLLWYMYILSTVNSC